MGSSAGVGGALSGRHHRRLSLSVNTPVLERVGGRLVRIHGVNLCGIHGLYDHAGSRYVLLLHLYHADGYGGRKTAGH